MQYINNEKREELKKEFIKGFSEEGFYLVTDREYGVFATYWLNKAEELVAERVQAIREEAKSRKEQFVRVKHVTNDGRMYEGGYKSAINDILSLPSLTPKK